jgi:hypothetical protein
MSANDDARHALAGRLYTSDGKGHRVTISHRESEIKVTVIGDPGDLFDKPLTDMVLESTGGRGVLRTRGTAQRVDHRVLQFFLNDEATIEQRRQYVRIVAAERIVIEDDEGDVLLDTLAANISGGGALVRLPNKFSAADLPDSFYFSLDLGTQEPITGTGRAIRTTEDNQLAIAFDRLSKNDRERLIRFIFDRQRAALKITRGNVQ